MNGRLIRDKVVMHGLLEGYRNIIPPSVSPVVLLFLEMPCTEVDVNVHPSKTEVRFRQQGLVHDFVRDSVRAALMAARPAPAFAGEIYAAPSAKMALTPPLPHSDVPTSAPNEGAREVGHPALEGFSLSAPPAPIRNEALPFEGSTFVEGNAAASAVRILPQQANCGLVGGPVAPQGFGSGWSGPGLGGRCAASSAAASEEPVPETRRSCAVPLEGADEPMDLSMLHTLQPLGQIRDSFILAINPQGLWIIDQHVAHERVLFEKILAERGGRPVESQRLLMPMIVELRPAQQAIFAEIAEELRRNGFEAEPFGVRTLAIQSAPAGIRAEEIAELLGELLDQFEGEAQALTMEKIRTRIAASIACHAAIKVNMPLDRPKMEWLLAELAQTRYPMSCPHGRPVVLRYSIRDIQKAFKRI